MYGEQAQARVTSQDIGLPIRNFVSVASNGTSTGACVVEGRKLIDLPRPIRKRRSPLSESTHVPEHACDTRLAPRRRCYRSIVILIRILSVNEHTLSGYGIETSPVVALRVKKEQKRRRGKNQRENMERTKLELSKRDPLALAAAKAPRADSPTRNSVPMKARLCETITAIRNVT